MTPPARTLPSPTSQQGVALRQEPDRNSQSSRRRRWRAESQPPPSPSRASDGDRGSRCGAANLLGSSGVQTTPTCGNDPCTTERGEQQCSGQQALGIVPAAAGAAVTAGDPPGRDPRDLGA